MNLENFKQLINTVAKLRAPIGGCPWDLEQTHKTLLKYLIEECYEFITAAEEDNFDLMEEEIGDVLLQVILHCQIASESKTFDIESVSKILNEKLIRRHPHVFETEDDSISSNDVVKNWQQIKDNEKLTKKTPPTSKISNEYLNFPALYGATKIGKATNKIKFDWKNATEVFNVVTEELNELEDEIKAGQDELIYEEYGDLLFSIAQLGRHLDLDPETALRDANRKFLRRFKKMELLIKKEKKNIDNMNQHQMDEYWNEVKREEKEPNP
jgi:MazG family protein